MPFYEYECQACKFYAEVMQKISEAPLTKCPSCGKPKLKKLVSAPVFRLKGGGWYETDFKSDKENRRNLLGAEREEPKAEKADSKEGKPEAKEGKPEAKEAKESQEPKAAEPKAARAKTAAKAPARRLPRRAARGSARRRRGR